MRRHASIRSTRDEPFTEIHSQGILGLFDDSAINEIPVLARDLVRDA